VQAAWGVGNGRRKRNWGGMGVRGTFPKEMGKQSELVGKPKGKKIGVRR